MSPELIELQKKVDAARLAKARAQANLEQAEELRTQALQALASEFGIDNLDDARAMLEQLRSQAQAELDKVSRLLDEIE